MTCCKHAVAAARDSKFMYEQAMATSGCLGACKHSVREGLASSSHSLIIATRCAGKRQRHHFTVLYQGTKPEAEHAILYTRAR